MACIPACYPEALKIIGKAYSTEELIEAIRPDLPFFKTSGGGITISGGEPVMQHAFLTAFLAECKTHQIHTTVQTNLSYNWDKYAPILPLTDLFMVDLKLYNNLDHVKMTGISNETILKNIQLLDSTQANYIVRTPVVPGVNDTEEKLAAIAHFLKSLRYLKSYELLPFHPLADIKYKNLGLNNPFEGVPELASSRMEVFNKIVQSIIKKETNEKLQSIL